ncbi:hypothetical protein PROFUN_02628 [Planoprotostelium fungivorum]|uniref:Protein kinase domain-containing protein n=1 Tax=Planoprotostelium fungivorum TaxID=1890364 RepID=A0A2P6NV94_9EUKA|nr:hypothetical protein PROFUN_02628 [Planoprotostelium fungivorum]
MEGLLSSDLGSKFYGPDTLVKDYPSLFQSGGTYDNKVVGALKTALDTPLRRHEDSEMAWGSFCIVFERNKSCGESLGAAEKDLKDKNNTFATSGSSIRFYTDVPLPLRLYQVGQVIKCDNSRISFHKDYVKKAVDVSDKSQLLRLIKLYTKLDLVCSIKATQAYWNGREVDEEIKFQGQGDLVLHLTPTAMHRIPRSVDDANQCVTDVLAFLASFHSLGYVHQDLRWPNVLACRNGSWIVIDLDLAALSGEQPPKGAKSIPPDAFHHDGFTYQHDLQMFGKMLGEIGEELSNSCFQTIDSVIGESLFLHFCKLPLIDLSHAQVFGPLIDLFWTSASTGNNSLLALIPLSHSDSILVLGPYCPLPLSRGNNSKLYNGICLIF